MFWYRFDIWTLKNDLKLTSDDIFKLNYFKHALISLTETIESILHLFEL